MLPHQAITGKSGPSGNQATPATPAENSSGTRLPHRETRKHESHAFASSVVVAQAPIATAAGCSARIFIQRGRARNARSCRDEVCRITVYLAGGPRLKMRTSEPRDRALWTLAASVPQAGINYGAWSRHRGNPHAYPPLRAATVLRGSPVLAIHKWMFCLSL